MKQREFLEITLPQRVAPDFLVPAESVLPKPAGWIHLENYPVPPAVPKRPPGPPPLRPRPPSSKPPPHIIGPKPPSSKPPPHIIAAARRAAAPENAAPENARDQAQRLPMQETEAPVQEADEQTEASFSEISDADTPRNDDADAEARTASAAGNLVNLTFASSVQQQMQQMTLQHAETMAQSFNLIHSIQQQQMQMLQSAASYWSMQQPAQFQPLHLSPIPPAVPPIPTAVPPFPPAVPTFRPQPVYPVGGSSSSWMPTTPAAGSPFIGGVLPTAMPGRATFGGPGSVLGALPKEMAPKPPPPRPSHPKPSPEDHDADDQQLQSDPYGGGEEVTIVVGEQPNTRIRFKTRPQAARRPKWKPAPKGSAAAPVAAPAAKAPAAPATAPAAEAAASAVAPSAATTAAAAPATGAAPAVPGQPTPASVSSEGDTTGERATGDTTGAATPRGQEQPNDKAS